MTARRSQRPRLSFSAGPCTILRVASEREATRFQTALMQGLTLLGTHDAKTYHGLVRSVVREDSGEIPIWIVTIRDRQRAQ